jgi:colicin import membrane protein
MVRATSAKLPRARPRKSRAQTEEEFSTLEKEVHEQEPVDQTVAEHEKRRRDELLQSVEASTVETVTQRIAGLSVEVSRALGQVAEQLVGQVQELERLREAVALEKEELERLHQIDIAATAVNALVADYAVRREQQRAEQEAERAGWVQEEKAREQQRKEQEESLKKAREREVEEYEYKKALERKKAQDKFDEQLQKLEKQNRERQEALEKGWQQREEALKARENELAELRAQVEGFPGRLTREVESAVAAAVENLKREHETRVQLLSKDFEANGKLSALHGKALEEQLAKQTTQIADLQQQLQLAKQQVQEIAIKALDSAAGAKTLEEVRQIAREQAKREPR